MTLVADIVPPVAVAVAFIALTSLLREPQRREFNAIMVAGAGAAYLGAGLGVWEFAFTAAATYVAYRGLRSYTFIGIAWLLHAGWDVIHHFYGNPIVPFIAKSSLGCAICDPVIALWCFLGATAARWRCCTRYATQLAPRRKDCPRASPAGGWK